MISIVETSDKMRRQLTEVFQNLLTTIPSGAATLESKPTKDGDGTIVSLIPSNGHAASFHAHIDNGSSSLVDVGFGSTTFELPTESHLPNDASFDTMLDYVKAMGLAVIAGNCREYFGFLGVRGTIYVAEQRPLKMASFFHLRLFPKLVRYEPYVKRP